MAAIVPAAGCGVRTGLDNNKILAPIGGQPLLYWTLRAIVEAAPRLSTLGVELTQIILAARHEEFEILHSLLDSQFPRLTFVIGGATRQQSVGNAARAASADFLLVHDAARPLVSTELIARVTQAAQKNDAAIASLPASDTIKIARDAKEVGPGVSFIGSTPDRGTIWLAQTPQIFRRELYLRALENAARENFDGTDCASLIERIGEDVALVPGETESFKVTYADDLRRAESVLNSRAIAAENALN